MLVRGRVRVVHVLVCLQVSAILVFGLVTVHRFQVWAPIDEGAHFDYIHFLAEHKRLPILGKDMTSEAVASIHEARYPPEPGSDPKVPGLGDYVYEAFQPPLYYLAALPAYHIGSEYTTKVFSVRYFDLALLMSAVGALAFLCREAFDDPWVPMSFGLCLMLLPAVVVRSITVSNGALELPLILLVLGFLVRSYRRSGAVDMAIAGIFVGLALLAKLTLAYIAVVFALFAVVKMVRERSWSTAFQVFGAGLIPLVMLLPWLAFNLSQYDALTANELARSMQQPIINPQRIDYTVPHLPVLAMKLLHFPMPGEWFAKLDERPLALVRDGLLVAFLIVPLPLILLTRRRPPPVVKLLLGLPLLANAALLAASTLQADHDTLHPRYMFSSMVPWAALAGAGYHRLFGRPGAATAVSGVTTLTLIAVWIYLVLQELLVHPALPAPL